MLSAQEAQYLDRLVLAPAAASAATAAGLRHAAAHGPGLDFHDYRHYQPGDDPRTIDWTVHARHRQLVVRLFHAEGHARLHLLVDVSRSMTLGTPSKLSCARRLAAALAYVAIERRDAVGVATFDEAIRSHVAPRSGRSQLFRVFETLSADDVGQRSALDRAVTAYGDIARGPGLVVLLSDFFESDVTLDGARYLLYRGLTPAFVQIVAEEELHPEINGDEELVDIENPGAPSLIVDASAVAAYRDRMRALTDRLTAFCFSHRLPWLQLASSTPFEGLLTACVRGGLLGAYA